MSPFLSAVRAHQAERHPALDVGFRRNSLYIDHSPGARTTLVSGRHDDEDHEKEEESYPDTPQSPVVAPGVSSSIIQGTPTIPADVQVPPVFGFPTISLSFSSLVPPSIFPTVTSRPYTSSSSLPATTTTPASKTPLHTGWSSQNHRLATAAATPPADSDPLRDGATGGLRKGTGLSGGAIAAVVIVVLLAMGALAFLLLRGRRIRRRNARRATWTTNAWPRTTADAPSLEKGATEISLPDIGGPPAVPIISRKSPPPWIPQTPATRPLSHNSPVYSRAPSPQPSAVRTVASESTQDAMAFVRVTFVPQLPDELAITPGETLYIRTEFDDGWAMCANTRGEQGMVPLECLEGGGGQFAELPTPSVGWHNRDSRRVSSLRSPVA